jgi:uncharacterized protein (DUF433 family)
MTLALNEQTAIIRTEQGLTIAGTRLTLYDIMAHLAAGWTPKFILNWLPLTEEQLNIAISYINSNYSEIEAEYQTILQTNQEIEQFWKNKNREHLAQIAKIHPKPGQEEIYAKLQAWKAKLGLIE